MEELVGRGHAAYLLRRVCKRHDLIDRLDIRDGERCKPETEARDL